MSLEYKRILADLYNQDKISVNNYIEHLKSVSNEERVLTLRNFCSSIWYKHRHFAFKCFYVDDNLISAKQNFYTCGRLDEYATINYNSQVLDCLSPPHFGFVLLSDCPQLILRFCDLRYKEMDVLINKGWSCIYSFIIQCILKNDETEFHRAMEIMKNKSLKKNNWELDYLFFQALYDNKKEGCESIIRELVSPKMHSKKNKHEMVYKDFISFPATTLAKLAWLKGVNVEVDTHLIPQALLPLQPNEVYVDEYDFL